MSKALSDIRVEIDSIDNQVHDLLMRRASLVSSVAEAKKRDGLQIVQPAREARMMSRLLSRHTGTLPRRTIVRIWRELVSSVALLQTGFRVVVVADDNNSFWDMAKDYFGSSIPMKRVSGSLNALSDVHKTGGCFAILPWPDLDDEQPWWLHFFNQKDGDRLSFICALPYGINKHDESGAFERALVVSDIEFLPSDNDVSFIGLELDHDVSRARLASCASQIGFDVLNIYSQTKKDGGDVRKAHLIEVSGYLNSDDDSLDRLKKAFDGQCYAVQVFGGYPVIPDIREQNSVKKNAT